MNIQTAIYRLIEGKRIRRTCWEAGHYWVLEDAKLIDSSFESPKINKAQLKAEDWEEYKEKEIKTGFCTCEDGKRYERLMKNEYFRKGIGGSKDICVECHKPFKKEIKITKEEKSPPIILTDSLEKEIDNLITNLQEFNHFLKHIRKIK